MPSPENIKVLITEAQKELDSHPRKELPLPIRKRIWTAMGELKVEQEDNRAVFTDGHYRRTMLSILAAEHSLFVWEKHFSSTDPHKMVDIARQYLKGEYDFDEADEEVNSFLGGLGNTQDVPDEALNAVLAGHASCDALLTALYDAWCEPTDDLDEDLDSWDSSMYAAGAYADGFPWKTEGCDFDKLYEYWNWYLNVAIPNTYEGSPSL